MVQDGISSSETRKLARKNKDASEQPTGIVVASVQLLIRTLTVLKQIERRHTILGSCRTKVRFVLEGTAHTKSLERGRPFQF